MKEQMKIDEVENIDKKEDILNDVMEEYEGQEQVLRNDA